MIKILLLLMFMIPSLAFSKEMQVQKFTVEGHEYFLLCKTVLHSPDCHKCILASKVIYDPNNPEKTMRIIQRVKASPFHEEYGHFDN